MCNHRSTHSRLYWIDNPGTHSGVVKRLFARGRFVQRLRGNLKRGRLGLYKQQTRTRFTLQKSVRLAGSGMRGLGRWVWEERPGNKRLGGRTWEEGPGGRGVRGMAWDEGLGKKGLGERPGGAWEGRPRGQGPGKGTQGDRAADRGMGGGAWEGL